MIWYYIWKFGCENIQLSTSAISSNVSIYHNNHKANIKNRAKLHHRRWRAEYVDTIFFYNLMSVAARISQRNIACNPYSTATLAISFNLLRTVTTTGILKSGKTTSYIRLEELSMLMPKFLHQLVNCDQRLATKYCPQSPWAKSALGGGSSATRRYSGAWSSRPIYYNFNYLVGANWPSSTNGHVYFKTILLTNNKGYGVIGRSTPFGY